MTNIKYEKKKMKLKNGSNENKIKKTTKIRKKKKNYIPKKIGTITFLKHVKTTTETRYI